MKTNKQKHKDKTWYKLDNAAKIYPAAMSKRWSALFRVSATLKEPVCPDILAQALDGMMPRFPGFSLRLRKGVFWFYLESVEGSPGVEPDVINPCSYMNLNDGNGFMFRIRYHECRIAIELFHVLADGTGAMVFLKTLVAEYLRIRHGAVIPRNHEILDCTEPVKPEELEDSFEKYARNETIPRAESASYRIKGVPLEHNSPGIITGIMPADQVHARAKFYRATVTEYLVAALVAAIRDVQKTEINRRKRKMKVKLCVPVNLRNFYPTTTLRNFSSFINPGINPRLGDYTFEETLRRIQHLIGLDASEKMINARMSKNVSDARKMVIRVVPLFIKNTTLKLAYWKNGDRVSSSTLSNLGVVKLPDEMAVYVDRFDMMIGPLLYNPVASTCVTYNNKLVMTFTRTIKEAEVERNFFTFLVKEGIPVQLESNQTF